ncbi:hypothetical protein I4F81_004993 [Pyropia yezoensis]|uniref:Uncharacterized protein n=1 Tax=Pyropia yezoensis TaxID=2788 RepID=A0ACC3BXI3_PYRYE|nr:hypothetical protein I4F81_004993 [Neopyropia yezoensis]
MSSCLNEARVPAAMQSATARTNTPQLEPSCCRGSPLPVSTGHAAICHSAATSAPSRAVTSS